MALILTVDPVTAGVALALEAAALPWCGVGPRRLLRTGWVVLVGAVPAGVFTLLFGVDDGRALAEFGPLDVTTGSALSGLAIGLRILAVGLPGVVLLATTDPTDLADSLAQNLRLPHRFVLSALASLRLVGLLAQEWQTLTMARRARGFDDRPGLHARGLHVLRRFAGQVFALLVIAIRRGTTLATTMEARGFGVDAPRTWARRSRFGLRDWLLVFGGIVLAALATAAGMAAGTWNLLLSS